SLREYGVMAELPGCLEAGEPEMGHSWSIGVDLRNPNITGRPLGSQAVRYGVIIATSLESDGTLRAAVRIPMTPCAVLAGRVTDPGGVPLSGLAVEVQLLQAAAKPRIVTQLRTNDLGEFRTSRLSPGDYYLRA